MKNDCKKRLEKIFKKFVIQKNHKRSCRINNFLINNLLFYLLDKSNLNTLFQKQSWKFEFRLIQIDPDRIRKLFNTK